MSRLLDMVNAERQGRTLALPFSLICVESKMGAVVLGFRWHMITLSSYRLSPTYHDPVSHQRSSNRTCGTTASGFPTDFTLRHTAVGTYRSG